MDHLFVYGSLRSSQAPPKLRELLAPLVRLGRATTPGVLYDLGPYPGAVFGGNSEIIGEVLELPDESRLLAALDEYEGFDADDPQGSLYLRVRRTVILADGRPLECWAYSYNGDFTGRPMISSGDYIRR